MRKEFFNKKNVDLGIHVVNCGYEDCCPNFVCSPRTRNYYLIHYIVKGTGFFEAGNKKYSLKAGDLFVIHPKELTTYFSPDVNQPWSFCWIGFHGSMAPKYLEEIQLKDSVYTLHLNNSRFLSNIQSCLDYIDTDKENISQLKLNSFLMNALFLIQQSQTMQHERHSAVDLADRAVRYIEYNYANSISPRDISEYLNIDRTYLYRIFKKYVGASPEQYLIHYRIKKSSELIATRKYSITQVAQYVGINDIYYFSKLFKKVMGLTPTEYQKRSQIL